MQISNMEEILTFKKFLSVLESIQNDINKSVKTMVFIASKETMTPAHFDIMINYFVNFVKLSI